MNRTILEHLSHFRNSQMCRSGPPNVPYGSIPARWRATCLNGVLLGAAAEKGMPGVCLLGEMPHVFAQFPFPKASLAVLRVFAELAKIQLDFAELEQQAQDVEQRLGEFLAKLEQQMANRTLSETEEEALFPPAEPNLAPEDERRIEELFVAARQDRSRAYELKSELDRLKVFAEYEDRFLDLFKKDDLS